MQPDANILRDDTYRVRRYHKERLYRICVLKVLKVAGVEFHLGVYLEINGDHGYLKVGSFSQNMLLKGYGFSKHIIFSTNFLPGKLASIQEGHALLVFYEKDFSDSCQQRFQFKQKKYGNDNVIQTRAYYNGGYFEVK